MVTKGYVKKLSCISTKRTANDLSVGPVQHFVYELSDLQTCFVFQSRGEDLDCRRGLVGLVWVICGSNGLVRLLGVFFSIDVSCLRQWQRKLTYMSLRVHMSRELGLAPCWLCQRE